MKYFFKSINAMLPFLVITLLFIDSLNLIAQSEKQPVRLFLDTDVIPDAGDVAAITFLNGLADKCEVKIIGITCTVTAPYSAGCVDAICCWCKRPNIPIGQIKGPDFGDRDEGYAENIAKKWPNRYRDGSKNVPDAVTVFRQVLSQQPDGSVVMVAIGPLRNLSNFLQSKADSISPLTGREIIAKKVKFLSAMAGDFKKCISPNDSNCMGRYFEFNVIVDIPSAQYVVKNWPTPIMFSGFEIGESIIADGLLVEKSPDSPQASCLVNGGRPAWDQTSILYAVRGLSNYWAGEMEGRVEIADNGSSIWKSDNTFHQGYLIPKMKNADLGKIISQLEAEAGHTNIPSK